MTVGIVGLGLIGGSLARAYREAGHRVLAFDRDGAVLEFAQVAEAVDEPLCEENLGECRLLLLALYPRACVAYLEQMAGRIARDTVVIDCCGTKTLVCREGFRLAARYGWLFVGGHPMAGNHHSGFRYSRANLFHGAPMVLVPPVFDEMQLLDRVTTLLAPAAFGRYSVTTAEDHDRMIAFTSQLAHVVSNAYIKSPTADAHKGFSAGSYRDLTRVAWLNPAMWTELFLENRANLLREIDMLQSALSQYRQALAEEDGERLYALLEEGKIRKEKVDGR